MIESRVVFVAALKSHHGIAAGLAERTASAAWLHDVMPAICFIEPRDNRRRKRAINESQMKVKKVGAAVDHRCSDAIVYNRPH
jgi:hypothetical protein